MIQLYQIELLMQKVNYKSVTSISSFALFKYIFALSMCVHIPIYVLLFRKYIEYTSKSDYTHKLTFSLLYLFTSIPHTFLLFSLLTLCIYFHVDLTHPLSSVFKQLHFFISKDSRLFFFKSAYIFFKLFIVLYWVQLFFYCFSHKKHTLCTSFLFSKLLSMLATVWLFMSTFLCWVFSTWSLYISFQAYLQGTVFNWGGGERGRKTER